MNLCNATNNAEVLRRTFEAKNHPKGSEERARLNCDTLTSEYMPSYRYLVRWPAIMSDGTPNAAQLYHDMTFNTKQEAETYKEKNLMPADKWDKIMNQQPVMSVTKNINGSFTVAAMVNDQTGAFRFAQTYYEATEPESRAMFVRDMKEKGYKPS